MISRLRISHPGTSRVRLLPEVSLPLLVLGAALLLLTVLSFLFAPQILHATHPAVDPLSDLFFYILFHRRTRILQFGLFVSTLFLLPQLIAIRIPSAAKNRLSLAALLSVPVFLAWFIFHFGNRQFGAWDFSILIDTGWRQIIGQRPYTDFITPNPPGFNLGIYYAFRLFGVTWNAQLFALILFSIVTFFWSYWLLRCFSASRWAAILLAFTVQGVTALPLCFWWYNNVTSILASVFLLSALLCAYRELCASDSRSSYLPWLSYLLSFSLLGLMKPNIAGLLMASIPVLLLLAVRNKRVLVWTAAGVAVSLAILLLEHISIRDMLASYRAIAIERGGLSSFGLIGYDRLHKLVLFAWVFLLAAPLLALRDRLPIAWREKERGRSVAFLLLFLPALPVTLYGILTNGEFKDCETPVLVVSCGVLCLVLRYTRPWLRIFFVAMLVSMLGSALYFGIARDRVLGIGPGQFFEYTAGRPIRDNLFSSLTATPYLDEVQSEVRRANLSFPGPVFLGPRLEFDYADLRIPSPAGWPVYYQPGTSFARRDIPRVTTVWKAHKFKTLIFLGDDRTFYPKDLLQSIDANYVRQPGFRALQVYTRRHAP